MTDAADIAKALTPAQRKALRFLASQRRDEWKDPYYCDDFDGRAGSALVRKRLAEKTDTTYPAYRLTDLGRAVAAELEG